MKRPQLIPNWKVVLFRAWSIWLTLIGVSLVAAEVLIQFYELPFPPHVLALIGMVVNIGAIPARIFLQARFARWRQ